MASFSVFKKFRAVWSRLYSRIDRFGVFSLLVSFVIVMIVVSAAIYIYHKDYSDGRQPEIGVTFIKSYAEYLGLDWRATYVAILDDLKVKNIRLVAQWNEVEPQFQNYQFDDLEWQVAEAKERGINVILALGRRTPRWPECHDPAWLKDLNSMKAEQEQLSMVRDVISNFKKFDNITVWQLENEPFLTVFGDCPVMTTNLLKREVALAKSLDTRPVMITDSGELSTWFDAAKLGDKFGHTLYREVYNPTWGFMQYYLPASFYRFKTWLVGVPLEDVSVIELQAEPWVPQGYTLQMDYQAMVERMSLEKIHSNLHFAKKTGASEVYFWGVEWWYWLKVEKQDARIWEGMKGVF